MQKLMSLNYLQVGFGEISARSLFVPTCFKSCSMHTIGVNVKRPLILNAPKVGGPKNFLHLPPYLLLVCVIELFANGLMPFFCHSLLGWLLALLNVWSSSSVDLVSLATIARSIKKFKFLWAFFGLLHS